MFKTQISQYCSDFFVTPNTQYFDLAKGSFPELANSSHIFKKGK